MAKKNGTLKKVLRYVSRYWGFLLVSLFMALISVALTLYVPILVGRAIDCAVGAGQVDFPAIGKILVQVAVAVGITAAAQWVMNVMNNHMTYHVVEDVRRRAFSHLQKLPLSYLDSHPQGETVSRVISDVDQFADGLLLGFTQLFTGAMTILGTLLFMLVISPKIMLVVVLITPVSLLVANFIAKRTYDMFDLQSKTRGEQTALLDEVIGEQKLVQAFGCEERMLEAFDEVNDRLEKCSLRAIFFSSITNPATRFVNSLVYAGVGLVGALTVIGGGLTVGGLVSFLSYANQYTKPFNEISGVITELQNALACAGRVFDLMEAEPEALDPAPVAECGERGSVAIRQVTFSYDKGKKLIQNFNLQVQPGQRIAIVGPTGCGKTTLINLLMRFYDVDAGNIMVNGVETRKMPRRQLRSQIGMVLQDTWLKSGTIRENIAMGKPYATQAEVEAAAKAAHAHSFIRRLPQGYDTVIGESGGSLSQGQKQLLCIARVMLCLPPMLILDEATSSIDTRTEQKIQAAFQRMMEGRTSFIVAHRLSTIEQADVILVMKDGQVIEQGNHESLLRKGGFYAELYESQFVQEGPKP